MGSALPRFPLPFPSMRHLNSRSEEDFVSKNGSLGLVIGRKTKPNKTHAGSWLGFPDFEYLHPATTSTVRVLASPHRAGPHLNPENFECRRFDGHGDGLLGPQLGHKNVAHSADKSKSGDVKNELHNGALKLL